MIGPPTQALNTYVNRDEFGRVPGSPEGPASEVPLRAGVNWRRDLMRRPALPTAMMLGDGESDDSRRGGCNQPTGQRHLAPPTREE